MTGFALGGHATPLPGRMAPRTGHVLVAATQRKCGVTPVIEPRGWTEGDERVTGLAGLRTITGKLTGVRILVACGAGHATVVQPKRGDRRARGEQCRSCGPARDLLVAFGARDRAMRAFEREPEAVMGRRVDGGGME